MTYLFFLILIFASFFKKQQTNSSGYLSENGVRTGLTENRVKERLFTIYHFMHLYFGIMWLCYLLKLNKWKFCVKPLAGKGNIGTTDICKGKNTWKTLSMCKRIQFFWSKGSPESLYWKDTLHSSKIVVLSNKHWGLSW